MISLKVNVSRSGKDEIQTCDEMQPCDEYSYVNKSIFTSDVRNVVKEYTRRYGDVDYDSVMLAIKTIVVYFATHGMYELLVDINKLEYDSKPKKKMTKTEIEEALGYPIDIVEEEEK